MRACSKKIRVNHCSVLKSSYLCSRKSEATLAQLVEQRIRNA